MGRPRRRNQNYEEVAALLTQSTISAPQVPMNSEPVFNPPCDGRWAGLGVAGMVPFLQSLDPGYLLPNTQQEAVNGPAFTLGAVAACALVAGGAYV